LENSRKEISSLKDVNSDNEKTIDILEKRTVKNEEYTAELKMKNIEQQENFATTLETIKRKTDDQIDVYKGKIAETEEKNSQNERKIAQLNEKNANQEEEIKNLKITMTETQVGLVSEIFKY